MVFVQKWPLFQPVFLGNIGKENVFHDILAEKNAYLGYKNKKFKKSKNWNFSKGVTSWIWSKHGHFYPLFFLGNIGKEKVFHDILERKNSCLGYKKTSSKRREIDIFSNGLTDVFCPKMTILPFCFLRQYRQGKCLSQYSRTKERPSRL